MEKQIIIQGEDWATSIYRTIEWEQSVEIIRWEHNYEKNRYVIDYKEK
jgi:hypothetical protein